MTSASELCKRHQQLKASRGSFESHWKEIAERVLPRQDEFFTTIPTPGAKRTDNLYDSTGPIALGKFAAVMEALLTPRTQTWHKLRARNAELNKIDSVKLWFEEVNNRLFAARYSPRAFFATMQHENYMSLGAFGFAAKFIDKAPMGPMLYKSCHISGIYLAQNAWGRTDTVHREFRMTARQIVQKFNKDRLPSKILQSAERNPEAEHAILHCVRPNEERQPGKRDYKGMPWASYYCALDEMTVIEEGGYRTFPYMTPRYVTAPSEIYGRSPAMDALPDIKILNEAMKTTHRSWHRALDPPWLTADEMALGLHTRPGAINRNAVDDMGRPRVMPLITGANFEVNEKLTDQKRSTINDVFLVLILQIILDNPQMTATQVLEIAQQKGVLLAPVMGRQQSEDLGPQIERELDLLYEANVLPDPPEELVLYGDGEYEVDYESPLALAQKAQGGLSVVRTMETIGPMAQLDPNVLDEFNLPKMANKVAESNGLPADCFNTEDQKEALREQRAQQQAAAAAMQAAPVAGDTLNKLAQAKKNVAQANAPQQQAA